MTKQQKDMMEAFAQFMASQGTAIAKPKARKTREVKPCENIDVQVRDGKAILTIDLTVTGRPTSNCEVDGKNCLTIPYLYIDVFARFYLTSFPRLWFSYSCTLTSHKLCKGFHHVLLLLCHKITSFLFNF